MRPSSSDPIDLVIGTRNRVGLLGFTLGLLRERTVSPYRLTIIDDGSTDGTAEFLDLAIHRGIRVVHHDHPLGMHGNLAELAALTTSDPVISIDDDGIPPRLSPDWLSRLLAALVRYPSIWMLGMNDPMANHTGARYPYKDLGDVILSRYVSGHYLAIRRNVLEATPSLFPTPASRVSPNKTQATWVHEHGGRVGYLRDAYIYHYCGQSIRRPEKNWASDLIHPYNWVTLEPPDPYRQAPLTTWRPEAHHA